MPDGVEPEASGSPNKSKMSFHFKSGGGTRNFKFKQEVAQTREQSRPSHYAKTRDHFCTRTTNTSRHALKRLFHPAVSVRRQHWGIIHPRQSNWVSRWDAVTFTCLFYTAIVTPFEVGLLDVSILSGEDVGGLILFSVNQSVNCFFFLDILLNFSMAYQEPTYKGGRWIVQRKAIVVHYLTGWFVIDVISTVPFDLAMSIGWMRGSDLLRVARTIRLVRLVKLLRILRASRILARWQSYIGISFAQTTMMKFMSVTCFLIHLMACGWAYAGANGPDSEESVFAPESDGEYLLEHTSWPVYYHMTRSDVPEQMKRVYQIYVVSLNQAVCAMFGSTGLIRPRTTTEYLTLTGMMVMGTMVWAWVIASLCGILATLNPHATAYQNLMDELNYFMRERSFAQEHRVRLRDFFRHTQDFDRQHSYDKLLLKMSAQLRGDTALRIGTETLQAVWYFNSKEEAVETQFLAVVALNLSPSVFEAREILPTSDLTIIDRGVASLRLVMLGKGSALGKDCVIPDRHANLRSQEAAYTLTFVQTASISRALLFTAVEHFPVAKHLMRRAAAVYTIKAAFRLAFNDWRKKANTGLRYSDAHAALAAFSSGSAFSGNFGAQSFNNNSSCKRSSSSMDSFSKKRCSFTDEHEDANGLPSYFDLPEEDLMDARKQREILDEETREKMRVRRVVQQRRLASMSSVIGLDDGGLLSGDALLAGTGPATAGARATTRETVEKVTAIVGESERRLEARMRELRADVQSEVASVNAKLSSVVRLLEQQAGANRSRYSVGSPFEGAAAATPAGEPGWDPSIGLSPGLSGSQQFIVRRRKRASSKSMSKASMEAVLLTSAPASSCGSSKLHQGDALPQEEQQEQQSESSSETQTSAVTASPLTRSPISFKLPNDASNPRDDFDA